ncbi:MAG: transposase [Actinomycetota bacterium]|nr:transposase [Actinomycetota bacterium]
MTVSMPASEAPRRVIIGVDTHKYIHVAVAINGSGVRIEDRSFPADSGGYLALAQWAEGLGRVEVFGVEGTGSYGAGLASALRRRGYRLVEVNRGNRQARRQAGKSDTADAEIAARQVLAGVANAVPKFADGQVEMIRQVKVAKDTAV